MVDYLLWVQKVVGSSPTILKLEGFAFRSGAFSTQLDIKGMRSVGNDVAAQWQPRAAIGG